MRPQHRFKSPMTSLGQDLSCAIAGHTTSCRGEESSTWRDHGPTSVTCALVCLGKHGNMANQPTKIPLFAPDVRFQLPSFAFATDAFERKSLISAVPVPEREKMPLEPPIIWHSHQSDSCSWQSIVALPRRSLKGSNSWDRHKFAACEPMPSLYERSCFSLVIGPDREGRRIAPVHED